uniref:Uncharacterized protein n=1 Tax=Anguilla anguilla TaxID=7936 RepID=A0A0E9V1F3_ANGAN
MGIRVCGVSGSKPALLFMWNFMCALISCCTGLTDTYQNYCGFS